MMRENFLSGKNFEQSSGYLLKVEEEIVWRINLHKLHRPAVKALERKNRKIDSKVWGRGMWMGLVEWAQGEKICMFHVDVH